MVAARYTVGFMCRSSPHRDFGRYSIIIANGERHRGQPSQAGQTAAAVELHDPVFSPASDSLEGLRRVQVERQEEKPAVDGHGDPLPRTHADKQSAVTLRPSIW